jgi:hypothetical protein
MTHQILTEIVKPHADAASLPTNIEPSRELWGAATAALTSSEKDYDKDAVDILELLTA